MAAQGDAFELFGRLRPLFTSLTTDRAQRLKPLRSEGERRRLGMAARTRARERFTLETVLSGYRDSCARLAAPEEREATALPDLELAG